MYAVPFLVYATLHFIYRYIKYRVVLFAVRLLRNAFNPLRAKSGRKKIIIIIRVRGSVSDVRTISFFFPSTIAEQRWMRRVNTVTRKRLDLASGNARGLQQFQYTHARVMHYRHRVVEARYGILYGVYFFLRRSFRWRNTDKQKNTDRLK